LDNFITFIGGFQTKSNQINSENRFVNYGPVFLCPGHTQFVFLMSFKNVAQARIYFIDINQL